MNNPSYSGKSIQEILDADTGDSSLIFNLANRGREMEKAITEAREILTDLSRLPISRGFPDGPCLSREDMEEVKSAIAKLTPKPGHWDGIDADEFVRAVRDGSYQPKEEE